MILRIVAEQWEDEFVSNESAQWPHINSLSHDVTWGRRKSLDASARVEQIDLDVRVYRHQLAEFRPHLGHEFRFKWQFSKVLGGQIRCQGLVQRLGQHQIVVSIGPSLKDQRKSAVRTDQNGDQDEESDVKRFYRREHTVPTAWLEGITRPRTKRRSHL